MADGLQEAKNQWLHTLPEMVAKVADRWRLSVGAPFRSGAEGNAWVAPVTDLHNRGAVLKISFPHFEEQHEIQGLRFWDGDPTVKLLDADEDLHVLLLELCSPGTSLRDAPESEQDSVIAGLLRRLWRTPGPNYSFRPLEAMLDYWSGEAESRISYADDAGLVHEGINLFRELTRSAKHRVLLATDLHAGNVLRSGDGWLAIDPKPFLGDPAYDATQHLLNCVDRLISNPTCVMEKFAEDLQVCPKRVRLWTFARAAVEAADKHPPYAECFRKLAEALKSKL